MNGPNDQKVRMNPLLQRFIRGSAYLSADRLIRLFIGLFTHAWLARYLRPEGYGELSYILNFVLCFMPFVLLGLDDIVTKDLVKEESRTEQIISECFGLRFWGALGGYLLLVGISYILFYKDNLTRFWTLAAYGTVLFVNIFYTFELPFLSKINNRHILVSRMTGYITGTLLRISGILLKVGGFFFFLSYYIEEIIWKISIFFKYKKNHKFQPSFRINLEKRNLFMKGAPLFIVSGILMIEQRIGLFFIEKFGTSEELGFFAVSFNLVELWTFIPLSLSLAAFPILVTSFEENKKEYEKRVIALLSLLFWLGAFLAIALWPLSDLVIQILYGNAYLGAGDTLRLVGLMPMIYFMNMGRSKTFAIESHFLSWFILISICFMFYVFFLFQFRDEMNANSVLKAYFIGHLTGNTLVACFNKSTRDSLRQFIQGVFYPLTLIFKNRSS